MTNETEQFSKASEILSLANCDVHHELNPAQGRELGRLRREFATALIMLEKNSGLLQFYKERGLIGSGGNELSPETAFRNDASRLEMGIAKYVPPEPLL